MYVYIYIYIYIYCFVFEWAWQKSELNVQQACECAARKCVCMCVYPHTYVNKSRVNKYHLKHKHTNHPGWCSCFAAVARADGDDPLMGAAYSAGRHCLEGAGWPLAGQHRPGEQVGAARGHGANRHGAPRHRRQAARPGQACRAQGAWLKTIARNLLSIVYMLTCTHTYVLMCIHVFELACRGAIEFACVYACMYIHKHVIVSKSLWWFS